MDGDGFPLPHVMPLDPALPWFKWTMALWGAGWVTAVEGLIMLALYWAGWEPFGFCVGGVTFLVCGVVALAGSMWCRGRAQRTRAQAAVPDAGAIRE